MNFRKNETEMSRQIEFRAYGRVDCYSLMSHGDGKGSYWQSKDMMVTVSSLNIKTGNCRVIFKDGAGGNRYATWKLAGVSLMQYTGLKDRKRNNEYPEGQKIFEGDLVTANGDSKVFTVVFDNGCFKGKNGNLVCSLDNIEIIGNVHENKSLLK